jgi:hypothetical protein
MRIVQLMTDRSRYFNPSKNYWFSFNALCNEIFTPIAQTLDAIGKLYHLRLRVECTLFNNLQSWARTHAVLVIGS